MPNIYLSSPFVASEFSKSMHLHQNVVLSQSFSFFFPPELDCYWQCLAMPSIFGNAQKVRGLSQFCCSFLRYRETCVPVSSEWWLSQCFFTSLSIRLLWSSAWCEAWSVCVGVVGRWKGFIWFSISARDLSRSCLREPQREPLSGLFFLSQWQTAAVLYFVQDPEHRAFLSVFLLCPQS